MDTQGTCRICGISSKGVAFPRWVKDSFTNYDLLRPGTIICPACQFSFTESSLLLMEMTGKDKPQRMRNYSHFILHGQWVVFNKGQKKEMLSILYQSPEFAVLAESGQKHLIFRAKQGWLQFEEKSVPFNGQRLRDHIAVIEKLYTFHNKAAIETGRYTAHGIRQCGIEQHNTLEGIAYPLRGGVYFSVALFLVSKDTSNDKRTTPNGDSP